MEYLEKTIRLIAIAGRIAQELEGNEAQEIIKVINDYSRALNLLDDYDHKTVLKPEGLYSKNRNTVEFLGIWERLYNPNFDYGGFAIIKSKAS